MLLKKVFKNTTTIIIVHSLGITSILYVLLYFTPTKPLGRYLVKYSSICPSPRKVFILKPPTICSLFAIKNFKNRLLYFLQKSSTSKHTIKLNYISCQRILLSHNIKVVIEKSNCFNRYQNFSCCPLK